MRPYETFVHGNSADDPIQPAERCLEVIESTPKSVERIVTCSRAAGLEYRTGIVDMTREEITDAAEWHRAKLQGLRTVKLEPNGCGGIHLLDDVHLVVRLDLIGRGV